MQIKIIEVSGLAPMVLAKLTQRGHMLSSIDDLMQHIKNNKDNKNGYKLPHTTMRRFIQVTIAIAGISTKAMNQLRTHAKRATFVTTSTHYSNYSNISLDGFVLPKGLNDIQYSMYKEAYKAAIACYNLVLKQGVSIDDASYLLPQGLNKLCIMTANLDDLEYIIRTRICRTNGKEAQEFARKVYKLLHDINLSYVANSLPPCEDCKEPRSCKCPISVSEVLESD